MEGKNAALMAEILSSLWPKPKKGNSPVIDKLNELAQIDWTKQPSKEKALAACEILKRIDDANVGKGMFAQVITDKIENKAIAFSVPSYIKDAVLWACSLDKIEEA